MSLADRRTRRPRFVAYVALVGVLACISVATLTSGRGDASYATAASLWQRVSCLTCSATWLADVIGNIALFVPLGVVLIAIRVRPARAVLIGAVCSSAIEMLQASGVVSGRTPALTDLASNTAGTWLGVCAAVHAATLIAPSTRQARRLATAWFVTFAVTWSLLAVSLRPATMVLDHALMSMSQLPFTPGYGWFAAESHDVRVNGVSVSHRGNGPVIVSAARTDSVYASVVVHGRDRRSDVVPIVFVHDPSMLNTTPNTTKAHLLLAQRGSDAWLSSDLLAGRWGLQMPALVLRDAFAAAVGPVRLQAVSTRRAWWLSAGDAASSATSVRTLRLSPALGWAMIQSAVRGTVRVAPALTVSWLLCWCFPMGYWSSVPGARTHARGAGAALTVGAAAVAFTVCVALLTATAVLSWVEMLACVAAVLLGWSRRQARAVREHSAAAER